MTPRPWLAFALTIGACQCGEEPQLGKVVPDLAIESARVDFGEVPLGATKRTTLVVSNIGSADLVLESAEVSPPFGAVTADRIILPGASGSIDLSFSPTNDEPQSATLIIGSNDPDGAQQVVLTGRGVEGAVTVRPGNIDFSNTAVGTSRVQEVVLSNLGVGAVQGAIATEGFTRPEHFSLSSLASFSLPGTFAIGPRSELILDLEYRPFELGDDNGRMLFEICGPRCGLEVGVVASAAQPIVEIMPPLLDFGGVGIGETRTQQAIVQNLGSRTVQIVSIEAEGGPEISAELSRSLPADLAPEQSLGINVSFTPQSAVEFSGEVVVSTTDPLAPRIQAAVIGRGEGPLFVVQPEVISFGTQREMIVHRRSLLLINSGSSEVTVENISLSGAPELALAEMPGLPARIGPGQSIVVNVSFTPRAVGEYTGTVTITSDDPARSMVDVPVIAGLTDRLCELSNQPDRINFGLIPPSFVRKKEIVLTNVGTDDCVLTSASFRAPLDPYISLTSGQFPIGLAPGGAITLEFQYAPTTDVESKANFVILTDDPVFPERHITLIGSARGYVDIFTVPEDIDFGEVRPGCIAQDREIRIYNAGTLGADISSITLTSSTAEIGLAQVPATPFTLFAGSSQPFHVGYSAADVGLDVGEIEIAIRDFPFPLVVPVRGEGSLDPRTADTFEQSVSRRVDVLFVIDDSCSMEDDQDAVSANFNRFIQQADLQQVDVHIGITTTTVFPVAGALVAPWLSNATPNLENAFRAQASVGINGSGVEQGLDAMLGAFDLAAANVQPNAGLFRPDAATGVVIVSDEDDQSLLNPITYFNDLRNRVPVGYSTAVVTGGLNGCAGASGQAAPAPRYLEFAILTDGLDESICADWASTLTAIGDATFGLRDRFLLSQSVDQSEPITVEVDGNAVSPTEWYYDPIAGALIFLTPPPEGAQIRVEYTPSC